jgi:hypothetical protein
MDRTTLPFAALTLLLASQAVGAAESPRPAAGKAKLAASAVSGAWLMPRPSPVVAIHSIVLPTGKVLQFSYPMVAGAGGYPVGGAGAEAALFDPITKMFTELVTDEHDIFCAGHSFLPDGRVFITGGLDTSTCAAGGIRETHFFDPFTESFAEGPPMAEERYYPTNLTLGDGSVLVFSGSDKACKAVPSIEMLRASDSSRMRRVPGASEYIRLYPATFQLPSGEVVAVAPDRVTRLMTPDSATWTRMATTTLNLVRQHSAAVQLPGQPWKVMICGGYTADKGFGGATASCETIDFSQPRPVWHQARPMHYPRAHLTLVLLPDKRILAVGGGQDGDYGGAVRVPELYDPAKNTWTPLPAQRRNRMYHSTAVLLPDATVLSGGQDEHRAGLNLGKEQAGDAYEIYRPAYLYAGKRPRILSAPASVRYGETLSVGIKSASPTSSVVLMSPSAVTHSTNMSQRLVDLPFVRAGRGKRLDLQAPADPNLAPPGYYMLFVLNQKGVPSAARMIQLVP